MDSTSRWVAGGRFLVLTSLPASPFCLLSTKPEMDITTTTNIKVCMLVYIINVCVDLIDENLMLILYIQVIKQWMYSN